MSPRKLQLLAWTCFVYTALAQHGVAEPPPHLPQQGVLLLKHGTTLSGFITPAGDRYIVLFGDSGEARVPASDVAAFVSDLQAAYEHKRSLLDESLAARVDLVQWCLQHQMTARAADQILAAERLFGPQPVLESLHQRLLASVRVSPQGTSPSKDREALARVSFEAEAASYPADTIDSFTSSVQPLLLNRCAAGGCHNTRGTSQYILFRPFLGQATTRRLTERNLMTTLAYVNRKAPPESLLLAKAAVPHGGATSVAIESAQLETLANWVRGLGATPPPTEPTTIAPASSLLYQTRRVPGPGDDETVSEVTMPRSPERVAQPMGDPFNPAIFNQRHHGQAE